MLSRACLSISNLHHMACNATGRRQEPAGQSNVHQNRRRPFSSSAPFTCQVCTLTWTRIDNVHTGSAGIKCRAVRPLTSIKVAPGTSSILTMATHANMRLSVASAGHSICSKFWSSLPASDELVRPPEQASHGEHAAMHAAHCMSTSRILTMGTRAIMRWSVPSNQNSLLPHIECARACACAYMPIQSKEPIVRFHELTLTCLCMQCCQKAAAEMCGWHNRCNRS